MSVRSKWFHHSDSNLTLAINGSGLRDTKPSGRHPLYSNTPQRVNASPVRKATGLLCNQGIAEISQQVVPSCILIGISKEEEGKKIIKREPVQPIFLRVFLITSSYNSLWHAVKSPFSGPQLHTFPFHLPRSASNWTASWLFSSFFSSSFFGGWGKKHR